jgi:hypothetical protein
VFQVVCVLSVVQRAAARHPVHTPQPETHAVTTLHYLLRCIFTDYFYKSVNFRQAQCKLPEDGSNGLKYVGANIRYFNVNFNILYFQ